MNCVECGCSNRLLTRAIPEHTRSWTEDDEYAPGTTVEVTEHNGQAIDYVCKNCDAYFTVYTVELSND